MGRKEKFLRKCISCNQYKDKKYLIRVMKNHINGEILIEPSSLVFGRSVYICRDLVCIDEAFKKKKIEKFLKNKVDVDVKEKIKTVLEN